MNSKNSTRQSTQRVLDRKTRGAHGRIARLMARAFKKHFVAGVTLLPFFRAPEWQVRGTDRLCAWQGLKGWKQFECAPLGIRCPLSILFSCRVLLDSRARAIGANYTVAACLRFRNWPWRSRMQARGSGVVGMVFSHDGRCKGPTLLGALTKLPTGYTASVLIRLVSGHRVQQSRPPEATGSLD